MTKLSDIKIDWITVQKTKNINWKDYPCYDQKTGLKCPKSIGAYYPNRDKIYLL